MKASFQRARHQTKTPHNRAAPLFALHSAVREGFEPPVRCRTPVFEAGSFNHSDISPWVLGLQIYKNYSKSNLFFSGEVTHQGYLIVTKSFGTLGGDTADGVGSATFPAA